MYDACDGRASKRHTLVVMIFGLCVRNVCSLGRRAWYRASDQRTASCDNILSRVLRESLTRRSNDVAAAFSAVFVYWTTHACGKKKKKSKFSFDVGKVLFDEIKPKSDGTLANRETFAILTS